MNEPDQWCSACRLVEPVRGYVCAFCVRDELARIHKLPPHEVLPALEELDRRQFGYVPSLAEHMAMADEGIERLSESLRSLGVDV